MSNQTEPTPNPGSGQTRGEPVNAFEAAAIGRIIDRATAAGVPVPQAVHSAHLHAAQASSWPAQEWARLHPDDDRPPCCYESVNDPADCSCWTPMYHVEQQPPHPVTGPADITARPSMCGDCAYRKGSPERADEWSAEHLMSLPASGDPFWCHDGIRRPAYWTHPDGRTLPGSPDDYEPPIVRGVPYRTDGRPGLLCAGWAARAARVDGAADGG